MPRFPLLASRSRYAALALLFALACDEPVGVHAGRPAALRRVAGNGQQDTTGATLAESLAVRVVDRAGNPVPRVTVAWGQSATAGYVEPPTSITNDDGIARAAWTLGFSPGPQLAYATVDGLEPLTFTAQVLVALRAGPLSWTLTHRGLPEPPAKIVGIAGSNESDVFAATANGRVYWYDGIGWNELIAGPGPGVVTAMWGPSSSSIFATGSIPATGDGFVAIFGGQGWQIAYHDTTGVVNAIHGTSPDDIWAVGTAILHYDGSTWTRRPAPGAPLRAVWAAAPGVAFAGDDAGTLYRLDGMVTALGTPRGSAIRTISGTSTVDAYAGDASGSVLHWDGLSWNVATTIGSAPVTAIWAIDPTNVWAAGGAFAHYDGLVWTELAPDDAHAPGVAGMWGSSAQNVWAVTDSMRFKHYDGTTWREHWDSPVSFSAIWGSSTSNVYICGGQGTLQRLDGNQWVTERLPGWQSCQDVDGAGDSLAIATAGNATAYRFDGTEWRTTATGAVAGPGVWVHASGVAMMPGAAGTLLRYDGTNWSVLNTGTGVQLHGVWGSEPDDLWAGGDGGTLLHYDGSTWTPAPSGTSGTIRRLWGSDRRHVVALVDEGTTGTRVLGYDGTAWRTIHTTPVTLVALHGRTAGDLFVAGAAGTILHFDGSDWRSEPTGISEALTDIWASPEGDVFAVGATGVILRGRR